MRVPGRVARTGIQEYLARELGLPGDPNRIVRVHRPTDEVFNTSSLDTYNGADITVGHPNRGVTSESYRNTSVGVVVGSGVQDGDYVQCNLVIKDKSAIDKVNDGVVQLSAGYTAVYDDNVPEGADYEYIQRGITINHVALVPAARAGAQARLFDSKPTNGTKMKITLDSGRHVEIDDDSNGVLIADSIARTNERLEKMTATADALKEDIDKLRKAASDESIKERVGLIAKTVSDARKIAGETFVCDSVVVADIQRAALKQVRDSIDWADKSDVYVQAAFDMAMDVPATDDYKQLAADAAKIGQPVTDARAKAMQSMTQSWRKTLGDA